MGADDFDPMSQYIIVDNKLYLKDHFQRKERELLDQWREAALRRAFDPEARRQAQLEREQALRQNPLLEHRKENLKTPRSQGGLGKCYICNHPHRAKIEAAYQGSGGNALKVHRDIIAAGGKVSVPAVYNHFKKHYQAPGAPAPAQVQP